MEERVIIVQNVSQNMTRAGRGDSETANGTLSWRIVEHSSGNGVQIVEILRGTVPIGHIYPEKRAIRVISEELGEIDFDRLHPPCVTINFEDHSGCH